MQTNISIRKSTELLFISLLIITPLFTINDLLYQQGILDSGTPIHIKIVKDFVLFLVMSLIFTKIFKYLKLTKSEFITLLIVVFITFYSLIFLGSLIMFLSGIRWLVPLLIVPFLINYVTDNLIKQITKVFSSLYIIFFLFQVFELFTVFYYGYRFEIIANRTSGFFAYPTTAGFFIIMTFFLVYFYGQRGLVRNIILYSIFISLFMANSQTANFVYIFILIIIVFYRKIHLIFLGSPLLFFILLTFIYYLNPESIEKSLYERIKFLINNFENASLLGSLGQSSSTYFNFFKLFNYKINYVPIISDSFLASLIVNLGYLGLILISSIFLFLFYLSIKFSNRPFTVFLVIYGLFSLTMIITEVFPVNLVFSILLAYYLGEYSFCKYKITRKKVVVS